MFHDSYVILSSHLPGAWLSHPLRRWPSIETTLGERFMFAGSCVCYKHCGILYTDNAWHEPFNEAITECWIYGGQCREGQANNKLTFGQRLLLTLTRMFTGYDIGPIQVHLSFGPSSELFSLQ